MDEKSAFEAVLTILDETSKPLGAIMAKLGLLDAQAKTTEASLSLSAKFNGSGMLANGASMLSGTTKAAEEVVDPLEKAGGRMERLGAAAGSLGGSLVKILPMLGGFAALGSGAGLMELVHSTAELSEGFDVASKKIGISSQEIQKWDYIAKMSGMAPDAMNSGLEKLNKNMGMAGTGHDKNLIALLAHLNINLRDSKGRIRDAAQMMPFLNTAFVNTQDAATRAAMAQILFGESGGDMLAVLDKAPASLEDLGATYKKYVYEFTPKDQQNLSKFNDSWKNLDAAVSGLKNNIGADLAPVFTPIVQGMADWTAKNKEWIAFDIMDGVVKFENGCGVIKDKFDDFKNGVGIIASETGHAFDEVSSLWAQALGAMQQESAKFENILNPKGTQPPSIAKTFLKIGAYSLLGVDPDSIGLGPTPSGPPGKTSGGQSGLDAGPPGKTSSSPSDLDAGGQVFRDGAALFGLGSFPNLFDGNSSAQSKDEDVKHSYDFTFNFMGLPTGTTVSVNKSPGAPVPKTRFGYSAMATGNAGQ